MMQDSEAVDEAFSFERHAHTSLDTTPVVPFTAQEQAHTEKTILKTYVFDWQPSGTSYTRAVALGIPSLLNHSPEANAPFTTGYVNGMLVLTSAREIKAGEEITIDYDRPLWFEPEYT